LTAFKRNGYVRMRYAGGETKIPKNYLYGRTCSAKAKFGSEINLKKLDHLLLEVGPKAQN
jgi:hypothetical protein